MTFFSTEFMNCSFIRWTCQDTFTSKTLHIEWCVKDLLRTVKVFVRVVEGSDVLHDPDHSVRGMLIET